MNPFERQSRGGGHVAAGHAHGRFADVIPLASKARDFLVLTTQRTGSSWLMDRLDHSPELEGHMELFYLHERREPPRAGSNDYPRFVESRATVARGHRPFAVFRYLENFYARKTAAGFKLMYSQLREYPEILPWLAWRRLPVVHLIRANHLDVIISERLADATGTSHATVEEGGGKPLRVTLDPGELLPRIRRLEGKQRAMRRLLALLSNPCLETTYEDLCSDPGAFDQVHAFLRIDGALVRGDTRLVKRQRARHEDVIVNYAEVRDALLRDGRASLLHEFREQE